MIRIIVYPLILETYVKVQQFEEPSVCQIMSQGIDEEKIKV